MIQLGRSPIRTPQSCPRRVPHSASLLPHSLAVCPIPPHSLLALARHASYTRRSLPRRRSPLLVLVVPSRASGRPRPSQGHPRARPVLVVLVRRRLPPAPTLTAGIDRPQPSLSYVVNVVSSVFRCFGGMLQVFNMDVAKVDRDVAYVASVFRGMLQAFVQNVSSVSNVCCKHFDLDVAYVSHIYCIRVCSKCLSCFSLILH
jgi:hypothetical protein